MRKTSKFLFATAMAVTVLALANPSPTVMAKSKGKKSKVVYTLKKGTLTISGKGEMPKKMTFKNNTKKDIAKENSFFQTISYLHSLNIY